jgi:uncharacterized membrane protein YjjP (DUF1212 family)
MQEEKNSCSLPGVEEKQSVWPLVWVGLGFAAVAAAYILSVGRWLPDTVTALAGIAGFLLLFGGLSARRGRGVG